MNHDDIRHKLSDYIDDAVTPEERLEIEQHLASCASCSTAREELRKTVELLRRTEEVEPPAWMTAKIMARVRGEAEKKSLLHGLFFPLKVKVPLQAVAMLFLSVTAFYLYQNVRPEIRFAEAPSPALPAKLEPQSPVVRGNDPGGIKKTPRQPKGSPGYRSLDMKYSYERPEGPELKLEAARPAPSVVTPAAPEADVPVGQESAVRSGAASALPAEQASPGAREALPERPVMRIELAVTNIGSAMAALEKPLKDLSARVLLRNSRSLTLELDASKFPGLVQKLKEIGALFPGHERTAPAAGSIKIIILLLEKG